MKIRQPNEMMNDQTIVKHYAGSLSYGTNLPGSDIDIRGIFCADDVYHRSPWYNVNEINVTEDEDTKLYELTKYLKLCVDQNPNILESLWVAEEDVITSSPAYAYLTSVRHELLSSKCVFTYSGYAFSQLKRIKGHNKWLTNPQPKEPPREAQYVSLVQNFTEEKILKMTPAILEEFNYKHRLIPYGNNIFGIYPMERYSLYDRRGKLNTIYEDNDVHSLGLPKMIIKFNRDEYKRNIDVHRNYWEWVRNRNDKRSELEAAHGYDTKHAMHLIRLLRMGKEILTEGIVRVKRPDAQELLEIRNGAMTYDEIIAYAEGMDKELRSLYNSGKSVIQKRVSVKRATEILMNTQETVWRKL